jgi:hypothetical protein
MRSQVVARTEHPLQAIARGLFERAKMRTVACGESRPLAGVESAEPLFRGGILHQEYAPRLTIAACGSPGGGFEHTMQDLVGNRIGSQPSDGAQCAHGLVNADFCHWRTPPLTQFERADQIIDKFESDENYKLKFIAICKLYLLLAINCVSY